MKKLLMVCLFLAACDEQKWHTEVQGARKNAVNSDMEYYKDNRTGLCYGTLYLGSQSTAIANVPCSPEVERLIK